MVLKYLRAKLDIDLMSYTTGVEKDELMVYFNKLKMIDYINIIFRYFRVYQEEDYMQWVTHNEIAKLRRENFKVLK